MPQIRQEINILTANFSVVAGFDNSSKELIQLDTTQYVNPTYYFEIVAKQATSSGTQTVRLRRKGTTTDDATITLSTTSYTRTRSAALTLPAGQTEYFVYGNASAAAINVQAARLIIIDNPTALTSTQTQLEIGMTKTGLTSTTSTKVVPDTTLTKYWKYTAANWDGTKTFYAEVTYLMASSKSSGTFVLQEDNGSFASWADKVTIVNAGVDSAATRVRSASFTPTDGRNYRIAYLVASSKSAASIFNAKIIVDQSGPSAVFNSYYFNASLGGPTDVSSVWTNDANAFDGSTVTSATTTAINGTTSANNLFGAGTTAPTSGDSISLVRARIYGSETGVSSLVCQIYTSGLAQNLGLCGVDGSTPAWGSYTSLTVPSGGWTWSKVNALETKFYYPGGDASNTAAYRVEVEVSTFTGQVTLIEPQYLLLNTADAGGTVNQDYDTLWDSTEWSGVTNVYKHAMDSDNASNSADLVDIDNSDTQVTNSSVTGANQQISAALTMPTTGHQIDTDIDNTTGVVAASRILVAVSVSAAPTTPFGKNIFMYQAVNRASTY